MILIYTLIFTLTMPDHPLLSRMVGPFTVLKYLGIVCVIISLLEMFSKNTCPALSRLVPSRWFLLYISVALISSIARDGASAWQTDPFMFTLSTFSLYLVTVTMISNLNRLRWAVLVVLGSVAWGSLYVIRQWQQFHDLFEGFRTWGGLAGDPNYYAVTVVLWVPLMVFWIMAKRPVWEQWFCFGCIAVTLIGFLFVASRGGFLGLSGASLFLIWHTRNRLRNLVIIGLLVLAVAFFGPGRSLFTRLVHPSAGDEESSQYRLELWDAAEQTFLDHPLFGVGMGHYNPSIVRNGQIVYLPFHVAHNTYLDLTADMGLAGIIPFLAVLGGSFINLQKISRRTKTEGHTLLHQLALGLQAGLIGYMICAFFLSTVWQQVFWFSIFLSMCLPSIEASLVAQYKSNIVTSEKVLVPALSSCA